jgi:serine/threonine protein phosphatase PrpC
VITLAPGRPGRLLLCTDGLWNYAAAAPALHHLIERLPPEASAAALARGLTDVALHRGGRDNITVVVIDVDPS